MPCGAYTLIIAPLICTCIFKKAYLPPHNPDSDTESINNVKYDVIAFTRSEKLI